jgi:hypothetical protein
LEKAFLRRKSFCDAAYPGFRSFVINNLRTRLENDVGLAFIYFNYKEQQTLSDVLGSLLKQLIRRAKRMSNEIRTLHERCDNGKRRPTSGELSTLLQSESGFLSSFFVVVDALDECPSVDDSTSKFLLELQKLRISLLVTSRSHLESVVQRLLPGAVRLEIRAHDEDIKKYLDEQIKKKNSLGILVGDSTALRETIKNKVTEKAKGMSVPPSQLSQFL